MKRNAAQKRSAAHTAAFGLPLLVLGGLCLAPAASPNPAASPKPPVSTHLVPPRPVYTRDVAPILAQACVSCHRPNAAAPFALQTYADAKRRAPLIAAVTEARYMPPWLPAPGGGPFLGARGLTTAQRKTLSDWAAAGAPEGPPAALRPAPKLAAGWRLGPPDAVLKLPSPFAVAPSGTEPCRSFLIPTRFTHDVWVRAADFRASCPRVVRRARLFADPGGEGRARQAQSGAPGWADPPPGAASARALWGEWTPGSASASLPPEQGFLLRVGTDLILQLRFEPDGLPETEQSEIALYWGHAAAAPAALALGAADLSLRVNERAAVTDFFVLPVDASVLVLSPHGNMACRSLTVTAEPPSGAAQTLLFIPDFNPDWAEPLREAAPVRLPAGTRLALRAEYDNSRQNPRNAEGPLMPLRAAPGCADESAGTEIVLLARTPADATRLEAAVRSRPAGSLAVARSGGVGHG